MKYSALFIVSFTLLFISCKENAYTTLSGKTMGTYYSIQYKSDKNYQWEIDSLLSDFISAASTYDSLSEISEFNRNGVLKFKTPHLFNMLTLAKALHKETLGAFEPTLMPLIKAHGFATSKRKNLSQSSIDSLLSLVSFDYIEFDNEEVRSTKKNVQLDLSAMGEGFAIDMISEFLDRKSISNYKVEIGGEMKCRGKNPSNELWLIGIENPVQRATQGNVLNSVRLRDEAISTSGTSRKFFTDEKGKHLSHIIDPRTGRSIENNLLSVTIKNKRAVKADALATAYMVMGYDSAIAFIQRSDINALITCEENGKVRSWHSSHFFQPVEN